MQAVHIPEFAGLNREFLSSFMLKSITDMVEFVDSDKVIRWSNINQGLREKVGVTEVVGKKCRTVYGHMHDQCRWCPLEQVLKTGKQLTREKRNALPNGEICWVRSHFYPLFDPGGSLVGTMRIVFDITSEKRRLAKKEEYLAALEMSLENRSRATPESVIDELSRRERQVLSLLANGLSNLQIAELLAISHNTVKTHVVHIFNKMGVNDRTQAAVMATRLNLI